MYTFDQLYHKAPIEIQRLIDFSKVVEQSAKWHPEIYVYNHIQIVTERAIETGDINLVVAAFFHDLGKITTTIKREDGKITSYNHEFISTQLVEKYRYWIEQLGADFSIVHYVVKEHMRAKYISQMRSIKRKLFQSHPYYSYVEKFCQLDNMVK